MKKLVILLSFACISQSVFGTYAVLFKGKFRKNFVHKSIERDSANASSSVSGSIRNVNETASNNAMFPKDSRKSYLISDSEKSDSSELSKIDSVVRERIKNFCRNFKSQFYSAQQVEKALIEYASHPNESMQTIALRNKLPISTLYWWKSNAGFSLRRVSTIQDKSRRKIDPETREKIRNFSQNLRSHIYKTQQIEKALMEYVSLFDHSIENIAKTNEIPIRTLSCWITKLNLNSRREDRHKRARRKEKKLITSINHGIEWQNLHKAIGKKRNATINILRKLQDQGQIEVSLTEEKKNRIIKDYREKVLTNKGIARKYNITESDVYCVVHEARQKKKDLSMIKLKWKITHHKYHEIPKAKKEKMVRDYNKGLLTLRGIGIKHDLSTTVVQYVLYGENGKRIKRRNGRLRKMEDLVYDIMNKSDQEIEKKYGYKPIYIDELKRCARQWQLLSDDQKHIFKNMIRKGVTPPEKVISEVSKSSINAVNEKFKKILFVLGAKYEDIMDKYGITRKSANKLKRESEFWKIMSEQE